MSWSPTQESFLDFDQKNETCYDYNGTHLWSLQLADQNYYRIANTLPCRIITYHGGPKLDFIDSCDRSTNNEFSIQSTLLAQKWIYQFQNPLNCSDKRFAIIHNYAISGYGSTMHQVAWAFGQALALNRIAIYKTPGNWMYGDCALSTPECTFLPITSCSIPKNPEKDQITYIDANVGHWPKPVYPEVFRNHSFNWYRAQLIFYLMRFKPEVLERIQSIIRRDIPSGSIDLHHPYIALYVRRSDKVRSREMSQAYSVDQYLDLFHDDAQRARIRKIFINSEEQNVFAEFDESNKKRNNYYQPISINATRNAIFSNFRQLGPNQRATLTIEFLADLYIEANADLHVGTLTSNWCRLVDEFRLVLGKSVPYYTPENKHYIDY